MKKKNISDLHKIIGQTIREESSSKDKFEMMNDMILEDTMDSCFLKELQRKHHVQQLSEFHPDRKDVLEMAFQILVSHKTARREIDKLKDQAMERMLKEVYMTMASAEEENHAFKHGALEARKMHHSQEEEEHESIYFRVEYGLFMLCCVAIIGILTGTLVMRRSKTKIYPRNRFHSYLEL